MEVRKLTIVDTRTQSIRVIESNATTLAELKAALTDNGINANGMDIQEGLTKTVLLDDASLLPHDVRLSNGTVTNQLVFRLTMPNRKIASGANRWDLYKFIMEHGLSEEVKEAFGRNYTNVKTEDLENFVSDYTHEDEGPKVAELSDIHVCPLEMVANLLEKVSMMLKAMSSHKGSVIENDSPYSTEEIAEMFKDI